MRKTNRGNFKGEMREVGEKKSGDHNVIKAK